MCDLPRDRLRVCPLVTHKSLPLAASEAKTFENIGDHTLVIPLQPVDRSKISKFRRDRFTKSTEQFDQRDNGSTAIEDCCEHPLMICAFRKGGRTAIPHANDASARVELVPMRRGENAEMQIRIDSQIE